MYEISKASAVACIDWIENEENENFIESDIRG